MKKILYYIAISVICALPFNSCTLDEETSTDVEKKNFMRLYYKVFIVQPKKMDNMAIIYLYCLI